MSKPEFVVAVYLGHSPDFSGPPLGLKTWSAFRAEGLYEDAEYEVVRRRLLNGQRWMICEPENRRTVLGVLQGSAPSRYLLAAVNASLALGTIDYLQ